MTIRDIKLYSGLDWRVPIDIKIFNGIDWVSTERIKIFNGIDWVTVWELGGTLICYGYIRVVLTPPGGGVTDNTYDSTNYPTVDVSSVDPYPSGYQYIDLTIDIEYDDPDYTGGTTTQTNHYADYYIKDVNTNTVYSLGNLTLDAWYDPSLSIKTTFVTNAKDLYDITGSGTFVFYVTTTINGNTYTYQSSQQLVL